MLGVGTAPAGLFILAWLPGILVDPSPRNILFISAQADGCGWFEVQTLRAVPASALNDFPAQVALATLGIELAAGDKPSSEIHVVSCWLFTPGRARLSALPVHCQGRV